MISQDLIRVLADDRERLVAEQLRQRLVTQDRSVRWVRRLTKRIDRR